MTLGCLQFSTLLTQYYIFTAVDNALVPNSLITPISKITIKIIIFELYPQLVKTICNLPSALEIRKQVSLTNSCVSTQRKHTDDYCDLVPPNLINKPAVCFITTTNPTLFICKQRGKQAVPQLHLRCGEQSVLSYLHQCLFPTPKVLSKQNKAEFLKFHSIWISFIFQVDRLH